MEIAQFRRKMRQSSVDTTLDADPGWGEMKIAQFMMNTPAQKTKIWSIRTTLIEAIGTLERAGCTTALFEAEYLMQSLLGISRVELFLHREQRLNPEEKASYQTMLNRRLQHEPLQYIVGEVEFWSRNFQVTPDVLIPRQETEFVLEQILSLVRRQGLDCRDILDMGTGSGVIADVLAEELDCPVVAVDSSPAALKVAAANINRHLLQDRVTFICSDLFAELNRRQQFDLIVSNPPYVAESEKKDLKQEVIEYEPASALFAGTDGLDCYRLLIPESVGYLNSGGWLCLEIGATQGPAIMEMMKECGYENVAVLVDYSDRPRLALGQKE